MNRLSLASWVFSLLVAPGLGAAEYPGPATEGDLVVPNFRFHTGETLPELRLHYATWGTPRRNTAGEVANAVLLLHGTLGAGVNWGTPSTKPGVLGGPEAPLDVTLYYVIAPDTIGSGKSSRPSEGLRMRFPHYNLEDLVAAERHLVEHLGARHLVAILGGSMGGRQAWQWGVQYPGFMDGLVPMISSPLPNQGRRGAIDLLPEQIIRSDPAWKNGEYQQNPDSARVADQVYSLFLRPAAWYDRDLPTRDDVRRWVREGNGQFGWPDANDFLYMMALNDGFDAYSQLERIECPVLMINMAGDLMVPAATYPADAILARLKAGGAYLEVKEESDYGHGALGRTVAIWGPRLRAFLEALPQR
jgi:homoserine O-acetyltransferase/O-succinyltransferase